MALSERQRAVPFILIHHSDRGIQYCSADYVTILREEKIAISMTQSGNPYDNALAERVNGTIKNDFFPKIIYKNHEDAEKSLSNKIKVYNDLRPHDSLDYMTPSVAHGKAGHIRKKWKTYNRKKEVLMTEIQ